MFDNLKDIIVSVSIFDDLPKSDLVNIVICILTSILASWALPFLRSYKFLIICIFFFSILLYIDLKKSENQRAALSHTINQPVQKGINDTAIKLLAIDTVHKHEEYQANVSLKEHETYQDMKTGVKIIISSINVQDQSVNAKLEADKMSIARDNKDIFFKNSGKGLSYSYKNNKYQLNFKNMREVGNVRFVDLNIAEL